MGDFERATNEPDGGFGKGLLRVPEFWFKDRPVDWDLNDGGKTAEGLLWLAQFPEENPNPVLRVSNDGRALYANPAADPILRYWDCRPGSYIRDACRPCIIQTAQTGETRVFEHEIEGRDFALEVVPVVGRGYVNIYARDITERKRSERELREHQEFVEELVRRRTRELEAANEDLKSFAYSVSHDLRSPLRGVDGYSKLLLEDYGDHLDEDGRFMLSQLRESALHMGQLIDDLLAFSRMGRREIRFSPCDVGETVRLLCSEIVQGRPGRRLRLEVGTLPMCSGDPGMVREVLRNLLDNSAKFTAPREEGVIEVGGEEGPDGFVTYFVRDNGVGFDPRFTDKLFQVFQRLHRADEFEGTGIGLALAHRIVERHGGRIWAEGKVDKGATVRFTLPVEKRGKRSNG